MAELLVKHFFPQNESFGFEALRAAGYANIGAADIGEIIYICSRIPQTDEDAWLREWHAAGDRATTRAENSLQTGNKSSARDSYLRAANYYRTAEFYRRTKPDEDTLAKELSRQSADSFYKAADLMPHCIEKVQIPYEDTLLPGTLFRPDDSKTPRPTLVVNGGYDSTREEAGWQFASTGLDLGFNVLAFDGPGQGEVIREQKLVFRPDWEAVVTPVMDYLLAQPYVAKDKVALLGISMGGYLVARAAAFEHRFAAVILDDGLFDFGCVYRDNTPWPGKMMLHYGWDDLFNYATRQFIRGNTGKIWGLNNGMWTFGTDSLADVGRIGAQYTLEGVVDKIKTPTLVLDAPDDHFMGGQPQMVFDALTCEKKFVSLSREDGGSAHCAVGAVGRMNQVLFDYLLPRFGMDGK